MPRKEIERNSVLEKLDKIQETTSSIQTTIAVNSEKIGNIEDHLKMLNGKVATQEANGNTMRSAVDILINKEGNRSRIEWLTIENVFKLGFGILLAYLLYKAGI